MRYQYKNDENYIGFCNKQIDKNATDWTVQYCDPYQQQFNSSEFIYNIFNSLAFAADACVAVGACAFVASLSVDTRSTVFTDDIEAIVGIY